MLGGCLRLLVRQARREVGFGLLSGKVQCRTPLRVPYALCGRCTMPWHALTAAQPPYAWGFPSGHHAFLGTSMGAVCTVRQGYPIAIRSAPILAIAAYRSASDPAHRSSSYQARTIFQHVGSFSFVLWNLRYITQRSALASCHASTARHALVHRLLPCSLQTNLFTHRVVPVRRCASSVRDLHMLHLLMSCFKLQFGGSEAIISALIRGIEKHGGRILLRSHVDRIHMEGGRAAGVVLRSGGRTNGSNGNGNGQPELIRARCGVVSNASVWDTQRLLPPGVAPAEWKRTSEETPAVSGVHGSVDSCSGRFRNSLVRPLAEPAFSLHCPRAHPTSGPSCPRPLLPTVRHVY